LFWDDVGGATVAPVQQYYPNSIKRITATFVLMYLPVCGAFVKPLLQAVRSFLYLRKIDVLPQLECEELEWEDEEDGKGWSHGFGG
jgi:hypothetical protein